MKRIRNYLVINPNNRKKLQIKSFSSPTDD